MRKSKGKIRAEGLLRNQHLHWKNTKLCCPYCDRTFEYQEMWKALGMRGLTMWEVVDMLGVSWQTVVNAVHLHKADLAIKGTRGRNALEYAALRAGYGSAREMLGDMRIKKVMSYEEMGKLLDIQPARVKQACEQIFLGGEKEEKKSG
jgi:hypothetical protein